MEKNYKEVFSILKKEDSTKLDDIIDELYDTWNKKQLFRTETEARFSVLNDGKFPTKASKYWQCVREQSVMTDNLVATSFNLRKLNIKIEQKKDAIEKEEDCWEKEILKIELEEFYWSKKCLEQDASDRVREILMWSKLKKELDDGSFDTQDPNTHQMHSLRLQLEERAKSITPGTSQPEVINVLGPLSTIQKYAIENNLLEESDDTKFLSSSVENFKKKWGL